MIILTRFHSLLSNRNQMIIIVLLFEFKAVYSDGFRDRPAENKIGHFRIKAPLLHNQFPDLGIIFDDVKNVFKRPILFLFFKNINKKGERFIGASLLVVLNQAPQSFNV